MTEERRLKLKAEDTEDLQVMAGYLQDAVVRVGDMAYLPKSRRFVAMLNRFRWEKLERREQAAGHGYERARAGLHFNDVLSAQVQNLPQGPGEAEETVLELLTIAFEQREPPSGIVTLLFSGDATIRLEVECLEAYLRDVGAPWPTRNRPEHGLALSD